MLEAFLITFREGVEAFLIVFIMLSYLTKTGRGNLRLPIFMGIGAAVLASIGMAYALEHLIPNAEFTEGLMAFIAAGLVITLTVHMLKAAKTIKSTITDQLEKQAAKEAFPAQLGVFLFTLLMITREGMEVVLFMGALSYEVAGSRLMIGALCGVAAAVAMGAAWLRYSHLINIGRFMQVTAIFLILFSLHLMLYGFHEMTEANAVPFIDNDYWHIATESFADSASPLGQTLLYGIIVIPMVWLGLAVMKDKRNRALPS